MTIVKKTSGNKMLEKQNFELIYVRGGNKELGKSLSNQKRTSGKKRQNQCLKRQDCQCISGSNSKMTNTCSVTPLPIIKGMRSFHVCPRYPFLLSPGDDSMPGHCHQLKVAFKLKLICQSGEGHET